MFDTDLSRDPLSVAPLQEAFMLSPVDSVTQPVGARQRGYTDCVLAAGDGSRDGKLCGIFRERGSLLRIVDLGRNPATLRMGEGA